MCADNVGKHPQPSLRGSQGQVRSGTSISQASSPRSGNFLLKACPCRMFIPLWFALTSFEVKSKSSGIQLRQETREGGGSVHTAMLAGWVLQSVSPRPISAHPPLPG